MMRFLKRNKRWFICFIFITYLVHLVPVYLQKNTIVDLDPQSEEITLLMSK